MLTNSFGFGGINAALVMRSEQLRSSRQGVAAVDRDAPSFAAPTYLVLEHVP